MSKIDFKKAWFAANYIYLPSVDSAERVAKIIGGRVAFNIKDVAKEHQWRNTCAVRMSYILNQSGLKVPATMGKTSSGADGSHYFFRVKDLTVFLTTNLGRPEVLNKNSQISTLSDKKGILLFEVSGWGDATGHATLFDGSTCYDACYFNYDEARYRSNRILFWELK
ncbi:MAG: type VI secretion system amidase effector protein Tae4 [Alcaligenaceae bacterium]|nr:type VI secretion system amidase effector protein Tae4 [Alcaligenaceae bacterium]